MNGSKAAIDQLLTGLIDSECFRHSAEVAVFPPYAYLQQVAYKLARANPRIGWGAQNISDHESGAYTGEVSGSMLREFGCEYVLVGHSERRTLFGESNEQVADKVVAALKSGITPVICVGESQAEREAGQTLAVVGKQLDAVMAVVSNQQLDTTVIAYEPVWAIGTGLTATPEQAQEVHRFIRDQLGEIGAGVRILYGGSVKAENAESLFQQPDIDGALVGGASLDPVEFSAICRDAR